MFRTSLIVFLLVGLAAACSAPQAPAPTFVPTAVPAPPTTISVPTAVVVQPTNAPMPTAAPWQPTETDAADPFSASVAQYYLDTTGFDKMASVLADTRKIDLSFRTRIARVKKVLAQMPLPAELELKGQTFNQTLQDFSIALRDNEIQDSIALGSAVRDAQLELSKEIDAWLETSPAKRETVDPFNVSLAQYYLDTAGFHDMALVLSDTQNIDSTFEGKVTRVNRVLTQVTWPPETATQPESLIGALETFAGTLSSENVEGAVAASETVHDAQHELSHAIDEWLETNPAKASMPNRFHISIAQYYLDSAGFHDMAEQLAENEKIDPETLATVTRVAGLLNQATWAPELDGQAQAFVQELDALAAALRDDKVQEAITLSDAVHDAQHDLSQAIDGWLGGQDAGH